MPHHSLSCSRALLCGKALKGPRPAAAAVQWTAAASLPTRAPGESLTIRVPGGTDPNFYVQGAPVGGHHVETGCPRTCCRALVSSPELAAPRSCPVPAQLLAMMPPPSLLHPQGYLLGVVLLADVPACGGSIVDVIGGVMISDAVDQLLMQRGLVGG